MKKQKKYTKFDSILLLGFSLIVFCFSLPLIYLSYEYNQRYNSEIEFVQSEISGTEQTEIIFKHSQQLFYESTNLNQVSESDIQQSFQNIQKLISDIKYKNRLNDQKTKRIEMIFSTKDYEYSLNKRTTSPSTYVYLQRKLNKAIVLIADESKLILDPESFTYHLMELSLLQAPKLIVELIELSQSLQLQQHVSKDHFERIAKIEDRIEEMTFNIDHLKEQAKSHNESHPNFEQLIAEQNLLTESYIDLLFYFENNKIQKNNIYEIIHQMNQRIYSIYSYANSELKHHLVDRVNENRDSHRMTMYLTLMIWVLSLALSTYLFFYIIRKKQSMQTTIEKQKDQLEKNAKLALLGEMATGIGHEIASPLTVISGQLTLLERKMKKYPEEIQADLEKVVQRGSKMVDRIHFIIKSMKGYAHQTEHMELKPISVHEAIEESIVLAKAKALNFGVELQMPENISSDLFVLGTESEVCQCVLNLISNSVDAIKNQPEKKIMIHVHSEGAKVYIQIQDNGPGVPVEIREKIFESLFSTKQVGEGTGLGLSLVSRIVTRLGGKIELLDSSEGACFQLTFQKTTAQNEVNNQAS